MCTDKVACSFGKCINKFDPDTGCENFCPDESSNCKYNPKCPTYKNENGCPLPEACVGTMSAIKKGDGTAPAVWSKYLVIPILRLGMKNNIFILFFDKLFSTFF